MADTEKITINLSVVDLGKIDLLVEEGFYSNRTDFVRTAIRTQLDTHRDAVKQSVTRRSMALGVLVYDRKDLERIRAAGDRLSIKVIGLVTLGDDIPPDLAQDVIEEVKVLGVLRASSKVKKALGDRIN